MSLNHSVNLMVEAIKSGSYHRIKGVETKAKGWSVGLDSILDNLTVQQQRKYDKIVNGEDQKQAIKAREQRLNKQINNMKGELQEQARRNNENIQRMTENYKVVLERQSQQFEQNLNRVHNALSGELRKQQNQIIRIENIQLEQRQEYLQISQELSRNIENERKERVKDINRLQNEIDIINENAEQKVNIATETFEAVSILSNEIEDMPHDKFAPGKLQKIKDRIDSVRNNIQTMPEGAWATCMDSWRDLWDLKAEIECKEAEFQMKYREALRTAVTLLTEAEKNKERELEFGEVEGEKQSKKVDIEHWSWGEWSDHKKRLQEINKMLVENADNLEFSIDDVDRILQQLSEEGSKLGDIIIKAGDNVAAAQIRYDIAEVGANILYDQLFKDDSIVAAYEGEDQRAGYILQMENENGTKATLIVSDADNEAFKVSINFENDDVALSDEEVIQRSKTVERMILQETGKVLGEVSQVGQAVCNPVPDTSFSDIEKVKARKKEQLRTVKQDSKQVEV